MRLKMKNRTIVYADEVRGKDRAGDECARVRELIEFACAYLVMSRSYLSLLFRGRSE
jgi:hypothetical protein